MRKGDEHRWDKIIKGNSMYGNVPAPILLVYFQTKHGVRLMGELMVLGQKPRSADPSDLWLSLSIVPVAVVLVELSVAIVAVLSEAVKVCVDSVVLVSTSEDEELLPAAKHSDILYVNIIITTGVCGYIEMTTISGIPAWPVWVASVASGPIPSKYCTRCRRAYCLSFWNLRKINIVTDRKICFHRVRGMTAESEK